MKTLLLSFSIAICLQIVVHGQRNPVLPKPEECGRLKEDYLYNEESITALDEYPWIGRINFKDRSTAESGYLCLAVLISRRHLLANSQCFRDIKQNEPTTVLLGDWNQSNQATEVDCNDAGECAPQPREYEIDEIALHPDFVGRSRINDIAVLALTKPVEFSDYIQPICLPSAALNNADFVTQYLPYGGFQLIRRGENGTEQRKTKTLAHVLSGRSCREKYDMTLTNGQHLCVTCNTENVFMSGSPLMGVSVEDSLPLRFYLIGLVSFGRGPCSTKSPDGIQRVSPFLDWISNNVV